MGLMELALLGGLAWFIVWTIFVFLQTILYTCLSCTTGFASFYFFTLDVNPDLAQPIVDVVGYGVNSVDLVGIGLLVVTYMLFRRCWICGGEASSRFLSIFPWT